MVAPVRVVPFDPDKLGAPAVGLPLVKFVADLLDDILVLDGSRGRLPAVLLPVDVPFGDALNRILAVGADLAILGEVEDFEGAEDGGQLGPLVGLGFARQTL